MKLRFSTVVAMVVGLALVFGVMAPPAPEAQQIKLTYANFPPAQTFPCVQMERWAKEVEKRTNGKVKVQTFPGGTLLPAKNIFDGVISGTADIGNFAMSYQPGRFPVSEAVDLPLGFHSAKVASLVLYDLIEKYRPKEFEKVKIITLFTCAPNDLMTSKPVKTLADLKGMELRVSGTGAEVIKRLGGIPIAMPMSDTPEAIQKGIVKGIVSSLETLKDFNYAAYCPYATEANLFVVSFAVVMNRDKWESLPADVKKVMDDLRREQAEWTGDYMDRHVKESLAWSKAKYNHQVFTLPKKDQAEVTRLVQPMLDDYIKRTEAQGIPGKRIVGDAQQLKKKYEKKYR
ncbi:MAG TPA: TRAP transporter substrate-binding protein [Syntrophales bacterium]|nr:TRAP transporter substrate-binding protein [Syntrophales bacterium]HPI56918.1 TRAP transporter substrate-binding protein [Syntrophales bacterium]HPN23504.1 TRAP transporter substrate-binding protein [Syntrophales bacterium]HQM27971.1 TRAP transporter substrate-binding protein [Syntrophales bacterium]